MSVVGLSSRGLHIADGGGNGAAASAAATIRRNYYCHECNRTVSTIDNNELICSNCNGVVLEEVDNTVTFTPSSSFTAVFGSISLDDYFTSAASDTDTDSEIELSLPLPPPPLPPPPLPPFLSANDPALHNYDVDNIDFSEPFPLSSPLPPPPPPPFNLRSRAIISGLEIDFSEPLGPDQGDNYLINLPPPPPPPPLLQFTTDFNEAIIASNPRIHRLAPLPPRSPPPRIHTLHRLPPPPFPRPGQTPRMPINIPTSTTAREIQLPYPLPPPPPPPPPSSSTSSNWDYFFPDLEPIVDPPSEEGPDNIDRVWYRASGTGRAKELVDEKFIFDRKMSKELMESEDSWQCAVCLDNLELNQVVKRMPCKHIYHSRCIMPWLQSHQTCPVCRYELS